MNVKDKLNWKRDVKPMGILISICEDINLKAENVATGVSKYWYNVP